MAVSELEKYAEATTSKTKEINNIPNEESSEFMGETYLQMVYKIGSK